MIAKASNLFRLCFFSLVLNASSALVHETAAREVNVKVNVLASTTDTISIFFFVYCMYINFMKNKFLNYFISTTLQSCVAITSETFASRENSDCIIVF